MCFQLQPMRQLSLADRAPAASRGYAGVGWECVWTGAGGKPA